MFAIILIVLCIVAWALITYFADELDDAAPALFVVSGLIFFVVVGLNGCSYISNIEREAEYSVIDNKVNISNERLNNTTEQLKLEAQKYVNYETDLFGKIKPDNANILLIKYPELKAIEAIRYLMEQITQLNNEVYAYKLNKEDFRAKFIAINKNRFLLFNSDIQ